MLPFRGKVVAPATKGGAAAGSIYIAPDRAPTLAAAEGSIYNSPLNQPALWAEPEPPRVSARRRLEPGRRKAPEPLCVREYRKPHKCRPSP